MLSEDFYTFRGYILKDSEALTASMEDYIEMIYRLSKENGFTRVNELARSLNVKPPSATKMLKRLSENKLIKYEKYGVIILTDKGKKIGNILLKRHHIIENFLKLFSPEENILEQTEKLEHSIDAETLKNLEVFLQFIQQYPDIIADFQHFKKNKRGF